MSISVLMVIAVGVSMDAFAVSLCKGLSAGRVSLRSCFICGLYFGGFQALMPLLGWCLGMQFQQMIERADHWIAFGILTCLGLSMIWQSRGEQEQVSASFAPGVMLPLALATSIDALALGVTFATLRVDIAAAVLLIGSVTFLLSSLGVWLGFFCGARWRSRSELAGGIILIGIGLQILLKHLGIFS